MAEATPSKAVKRWYDGYVSHLEEKYPHKIEQPKEPAVNISSQTPAPALKIQDEENNVEHRHIMNTPTATRGEDENPSERESSFRDHELYGIRLDVPPTNNLPDSTQ